MLFRLTLNADCLAEDVNSFSENLIQFMNLIVFSDNTDLVQEPWSGVLILWYVQCLLLPISSSIKQEIVVAVRTTSAWEHGVPLNALLGYFKPSIYTIL